MKPTRTAPRAREPATRRAPPPAAPARIALRVGTGLTGLEGRPRRLEQRREGHARRARDADGEEVLVGPVSREVDRAAVQALREGLELGPHCGEGGVAGGGRQPVVDAEEELARGEAQLASEQRGVRSSKHAAWSVRRARSLSVDRPEAAMSRLAGCGGGRGAPPRSP